MQTGLRLKEQLRARLEEAARDHGVSLNAEIVARLGDALHQETMFGGPDMAGMVFTLAAHFAVATDGEDWRSDPITYSRGVAGLLDVLIRDMPAGPDKRLAIEAIVSQLLTRLAQAREQSK